MTTSTETIQFMREEILESSPRGCEEEYIKFIIEALRKTTQISEKGIKYFESYVLEGRRPDSIARSNGVLVVAVRSSIDQAMQKVSLYGMLDLFEKEQVGEKYNLTEKSPVYFLDLGPVVYGMVRREGYDTIGDLVDALKRDKGYAIPGIGPATERKISVALAEKEFEAA